jgi:hypothetical protein
MHAGGSCFEGGSGGEGESLEELVANLGGKLKGADYRVDGDLLDWKPKLEDGEFAEHFGERLEADVRRASSFAAPLDLHTPFANCVFF